MDYRKLSTLIAVYTVIGNKPTARITRDRVRAAAMGYKSARMLFSKTGDLTDSGKDLLRIRTDGQTPLTPDQIRYTLDTLEAHGHFARVQASPRHVYFSHRMTRKEMSEEVFKQKTKRRTLLRTHRDEDRELQRRIRQANRPVRKSIGGNGHSATPRSPANNPANTPARFPTIIQTA